MFKVIGYHDWVSSPPEKAKMPDWVMVENNKLGRHSYVICPTLHVADGRLAAAKLAFSALVVFCRFLFSTFPARR